MLISNQATASLYNYTPYQPNAASLAAGYGHGRRCSSYGNRNFWIYFTDWFGSTQAGGRDVDAPVGRLETVADRGGRCWCRGWAYDPNDPDAHDEGERLRGRNDDRLAATRPARPDVAAENYGAGADQGFQAKLALKPGTAHRSASTRSTSARRYSNPRLGCAKLTITPASSWNPKGKVADIRVAGTRLVVEGWSFDRRCC